MDIIALSDIHSSLSFLTSQSPVANDLKNADIVLISGDITNFGDAAHAEAVINRLRSYNSHIFAVPGNCDPPGVDEYLRSMDINLNCNCIQNGSISFVGLGGSLACKRHGPDESKEQEFSVCLKHVVERVPDESKMVFVCHYPPANTKVDDTGGYHAGSPVIREFIEDFQPILTVTGHIHDAVGTDNIGKTTLVNPGSFREGSYALIKLLNSVEKVEIKQL